MTDRNSQTASPQGSRRYQRLDGIDAEQVNEFIRRRSNITAREWGVARACADRRARSGIPMTEVGESVPEVVPWIDEPLSPSNVGQTHARVEDKVTKGMTTGLWGLYSGLFDAEAVDDILYEATETAKFLLEVEDVDLPHDHEREVEQAVAEAMREVGRASREAAAEARDDA